MARTVLKGLRKKGADINFMSELCSAAVEEGSTRHQTRVMSGIDRESRFHSRLAADLPKVTAVTLPIQVRKKLQYKKFSLLPELSMSVTFVVELYNDATLSLAWLAQVWCFQVRGFSGWKKDRRF